jgi:FKBP-type peptidyl-prolyl cis-trans isomerase
MRSLKSGVKRNIIIIALLAGAVACTKDTSTQDQRDQELRYFDIYLSVNYPEAEAYPDELYYQEHRAGTGISPGAEDWMLLNYVGYEIPEENVFVSYIQNVAEDNGLDPNGVALYGPFKMKNGRINEGFTRGVSLMREGGQGTILFPSELGYGSKGNSTIDPYKSLKYEIELLEVIKDIDAYEQSRIDAYIDTIANYDTIVESGTGAVMYYIIDHATDGQEIVEDSAVSLAYTGMLLDGRVFDETDADNPIEFTVGDPEVNFILGWDLGLMKLKEGEKARLLIPYPLAYGVQGETDASTGLRTIPPYETLLFYIEVLKVGGTIEVDKPDPDA